MQKFVVIGIGSFGIHIAKSLKEYGCEVTGIDISHEQLMRAKDYLKHSLTGDATDKSFLSSLSLGDKTGIVVSIGGDTSANILIVLALKEIGVGRIIVRATSEYHCRVLESIGVSDIVFPERDSAARLGKALSMKNVLDYIPLAGDYVVMNINPPKSFIGKNIRDLGIGARFQCQILGIKYLHGHELWNSDAPEWENMKIAPTANDIIPEHSMLMFLGKRADLKRIQELE